VATNTVEYLTEDGRRRLEEELHFLRTVRRAEIAQRIREAKREGDVSENAGYEDAKHEQALIEGRIEELERLLKHAVPITAESAEQPGVVTLGCRVTICEEGGEPEVYQIVGSAEADPLAGRISNQCPLGQALLGRHAGEVVVVRTPSGPMRVRVLRVE